MNSAVTVDPGMPHPDCVDHPTGDRAGTARTSSARSRQSFAIDSGGIALDRRQERRNAIDDALPEDPLIREVHAIGPEQVKRPDGAVLGERIEVLHGQHARGAEGAEHEISIVRKLRATTAGRPCAP